jgi:hypothetical protein
MDFAFVVVCKVPNQNAKSKNRPSPRDFANGESRLPSRADSA